MPSNKDEIDNVAMDRSEVSDKAVFELPPFLASFHLLGRPASESELIKKARIRAHSILLEHGFPNTEHEQFKYVKFLETLIEAPLQAPFAFEGGKQLIQGISFPECESSTLTFINGFFRADLSSSAALAEMVVLPMAKAARTYQPLLQASWNRLLKDEKDPFALMNAMAHQDGLFLYVPPGKKIAAPIHIISTAGDFDEPTWAMPRIHLLVGHGAEVTLLETFHAQESQTLLYHNGHTLFELEEGAIVHHAQAAFDQKGAPIIHTDTVRAFLKKDACFTSTSYAAPSVASRRSYAAFLKGSGASATINGSWMLSGTQEAHVNVLIQHEEPHTRSMQLFKGVVEDSSRSSFEGKIYVAQKADKTEAYQLNNNLVLGEKASAFSKPNLEIFADDVKASHGSTTGQLDSEAIFYLQSRGIDKRTASKMLIEGFLSEVASKIDVPSLHNLVVEKIHQYCR